VANKDSKMQYDGDLRHKFMNTGTSQFSRIIFVTSCSVTSDILNIFGYGIHGY